MSNHYDVTDQVLGSGLAGKVHLGRNLVNPKHKVAIKAFHFEGLAGAKRAQLESEVEVFLNMDHPHIARLCDVYESTEHLDLVMECMEGGELFDRAREQRRFSERVTAEITWQMLLALKYIHEKGIMHGDVKMENFMFSDRKASHLKLIDFGFSKMKGQVGDKCCGTVAYMAPELLNLQFSPQADMWSLGVVVFVLLAGYMPFTGSEQKKLESIRQGRYELKRERWSTISEEALDFVRCLLKVDASQRLNTETALAHPFINNKHFETRFKVDSSVVEALRQFGHQERFRRCCLFVMAWSLSAEEREKVEDAFLAMDEQHHGALTYEGLRNIMVTQFGVADREVKSAFKALSVHSDREIHYSDFLAAMVSTRIGLSDDLLAECFAKFDVESNGYITTASLKEVLGDAFNGMPTCNLLDDVNTICEGRMCYHEFVAYMKDRTVKLHGDELVQTNDDETRSNKSNSTAISRKSKASSRSHHTFTHLSQTGCALM